MIKNKINIYLFLFAFISVITLYSVRSILPSEYDNIYIKQLIFYFFSFIIFNKVKSNKFIFNHLFTIYIVLNLILLFLLLFGKPINNAKCWLIIPFIGTIQPSEFMKILLVIMSSFILTGNFKYKFFKVFLVFIIPAILTFLEPDTGLVIIYAIGFLTTLFCYQKNSKILIYSIIFIILICLIILIIYYKNQNLLINIFGSSIFTKINRIINWKNQDGYQLNNALIAMGSTGTNINFNNINNYFPEAHNDFIFASIASSFGYFLAVVFLLIILSFDLFLIKIASFFENKTNKIMITSFTAMIIYQQIQNIGMNIGIFPITGITFPFISYGGSSLLSYVLILTIIKNLKEKGYN